MTAKVVCDFTGCTREFVYPQDGFINVSMPPKCANEDHTMVVTMEDMEDHIGTRHDFCSIEHMIAWALNEIGGVLT